MKTSNKHLETAQWVLQHEGATIQAAASRLDQQFVKAVDLLLAAKGKVVLTGLGKSGHVAAKLAATFASTGTPAFFLHPSEALHGDLGMLSQGDVLVAIAYSGETIETVRVAEFARRQSIPVIAMTGKAESSLVKLAEVFIDGSVASEACPHNLAPTASTSLAMALGDAMAMSVMAARGFKPEEFASVHPGGSLGKRLMTVKDLMHHRKDIGVVAPSANFMTLMDKIANPNFGIVGVVSDDAKAALLGVVTDGDIRRALAKYRGDALNKTVKDLMHTKPHTIGIDALAVDAFKQMESAQITSLFVTGANGDFVGLVRMHDLLAEKIV